MSDVMDVTIMGRTISLRTDGDPEYVNQIVSYLNDKIEEIKKSHPDATELNLAILASLNIADDYMGALVRQRATFSQIEAHCDDLITMIDSHL
ncbi:MAG: cell division protein ZapA [Deltaproteobacteria bacterium]|nr:cell division protein ZapA [Deltaproteobacteria bacterium]MCB9488064.1 cell division protein ZapA [Deltaproteobacteria bacterium]